MSNLFHTLVELFIVLGRLIVELLALGLHWFLLLFWIAWWLLGVNWRKAWPVLAQGAWLPLSLITVVAALVWSQIWPSRQTWLGVFDVPNFWWQLGACALAVGSALFAGWLQGVLGWTPPEVDFEPPVHDEAHDHGHEHPPLPHTAAIAHGNGHHG